MCVSLGELKECDTCRVWKKVYGIAASINDTGSRISRRIWFASRVLNRTICDINQKSHSVKSLRSFLTLDDAFLDH